jgi:galactokinase
VIDPEDLVGEFKRTFGRTPQLYRAPGRVNLIGEHTDYNDGFVMPMALDRSTWVAAAPRTDRTLVVASREYRERLSIDLDNYPNHPTGSWIDYVRGVAAVLEREGGPERPALNSAVAPPSAGRRLMGAELLIASDVAIGAGLSSSAALEIACGYALLDLAGARIDLTVLARAGQHAEHEFVGTRCGLMDQMIACHGQTERVLFLDTRTLQHRPLPLPQEVCVIVGNTMVRHELAAGEYNARRADCEAGVRTLARRFPDVRSLRDATLGQLDAVHSDVPDRIYRRCRHVISENGRVEEAADALACCDFAAFGRLMDASHQSLRDDYEVSCVELDTMAAIGRELDGVYGARMTGGGFGGCIVALVTAAAATAVRAEIERRYEAATGMRPDVWVCSAGAGVGPVHAVSPAR